MRRVPLTLTSAVLVLWCVWCAGGAAHAQRADPLTADEIVAKNIAAKGGADKLKAVNSFRITAAATVQGTITPMVIELKRPNLRRQEVTLNGQRIVQAFDGTNAWLLNPAIGEQPIQMPAPQTASMKRDAEFDSPLLDYQAKGVKVALAGTEDLEAHPAYHLKVTTADGATRDYYLDTDSYLEFRVDAPIQQNGIRGVLSVAMSDYRDVNGVKMPFSLKQSLNGQLVADLRVSTVELNVPLDASEFRLGNGK
jgi:outer membrane lipoprotein-sorting protein